MACVRFLTVAAALAVSIWLLTDTASLHALEPVSHCDTEADTADDGSRAQPTLPQVSASIGESTLEIEVAATSNERYMGLSYRCTLADDAGMLFVYKEEQPLTFTMRNTRIPLSLAYLSSEFEIIEIIPMNVGPDQRFASSKPARYALEVNQGWFQKNGVEVGDRLVLQ